jgi:hypothetical protein
VSVYQFSRHLTAKERTQFERVKKAAWRGERRLGDDAITLAERLRRLMCKGLADNALDACDVAGEPGGVTIGKRDADRYFVTDRSDGIDTDDLAGLIPVHRPMTSTKYLRKPERGQLGNGQRVVVGCIVAAGGTIEVITRGKRTLFRPRRIGPAEIVTVSSDHADLLWAQAAIDFTEHAKAPAFVRQPSPRWLDLDPLAETLMLIEPATVTVRQIIEQRDGCTGAKESRLAAPFGKNRSARSMSDAEAVSLLTSMQATVREVKRTALCAIGKRACETRATIPNTVGAWVCATTQGPRGRDRPSVCEPLADRSSTVR